MNQLLFDNKKGLFEIFLDYKEYPRGFTYVSACRLLNPLDQEAAKDSTQLVHEMQKVFYHAKMLNLKDKEEEHLYHTLQYVEFLDFIGRVALELWRKH